jgi:hypothetical protein
MSFDVLLRPPYDIFTIVVLFTLGLSILEIITFIFGFSLSKIFHHAHDVHLHTHADAHVSLHDASLDAVDSISFVNLFNLGYVPFLLIILSLSGFFSFFGFGTHLVAKEFALSLSNLFVVPLSVGLSSFCTYKVSKWWRKAFPNIESYAVSGKSLVGKVGMINLGTASYTNAVEIAVYDEHNSKHYTMAKVAIKNIEIKQNEKVILVHQKSDGSYLVLPFIEKSIEENILTQEIKNEL